MMQQHWQLLPIICPQRWATHLAKSSIAPASTTRFASRVTVQVNGCCVITEFNMSVMVLDMAL